MDEIITDTIKQYCNENLTQIILSNSKSPQEIKKVLIRPVYLRGSLFFQSCEYRGNQVFHENHTREALLAKLPDWLEDCMKQAQIWAKTGQATILMSKKGKVTVREKKNPLPETGKGKQSPLPETGKEKQSQLSETGRGKQSPLSETGKEKQSQLSETGKGKQSPFPETGREKQSSMAKTGQEEENPMAEPEKSAGLRPSGVPGQEAGNNTSNPEFMSHNRKKNYILAEGTPIPFLLDLGVMTPEGRVVHARYDKFRQINRFLEFIEDILPELPKDRELSVIDFGCGKSYLTFAMYYYLHELKHYPLRITGLDLKTEVIAHCNALAERYGYDGLHFLQGDIASYEGAQAVDMVVTLHACDTATDAALKKAVDWGARVILSVPCCQHELNRTIKNEMLAPIFRYGLLKERMAALITDGLRADLLEQLGYKVQVLEFIDMEHTPKNILLRAVKKNQLLPPAVKRAKREAYERCIRELAVNPTLYQNICAD